MQPGKKQGNAWPPGSGRGAAGINRRFPRLLQNTGKKAASYPQLTSYRASGAVQEWKLSGSGATGYLDTDYDAKAQYALAAIAHLDFLYLHIESPDEAGHMGSIEEKVKAIERVDDVVGMILENFNGVVAVLPDHPTPIRAKTHTRDTVPFAVRGKGTDSTPAISQNGQPESGNSGRKMRWSS